MAESPISDELWEEFHRLVNMTSRELRDWLATAASGEGSEALPDQAGTDLSRAVLEILGKRRTDLTEGDVETIDEVVEMIRSVRGVEDAEALEPTAGDAAWRRRLMALGHDPLKPVG